MSKNRYPREELDPYWDDDGTMPDNVEMLASAVVGRRIVSASREKVPSKWTGWHNEDALVLTLDNGHRVVMRNTADCCAYTELEEFFLHPQSVDHIITGVGTTDGYETWHIYADFGDIMELKVGWSAGNPFYYAYGFSIDVEPLDSSPVT